MCRWPAQTWLRAGLAMALMAMAGNDSLAASWAVQSG